MSPDYPTIKALTIWQPYATLIAIGLKKVETRSWRTNYRGPLVIHSSVNRSARMRAEWDRLIEDPDIDRELFTRGYTDFDRLPRAQAVAVVDLVDCIDMTPENIAAASDIERSVGWWDEGRFGFVLADPHPLCGLPMSGQRNLFDAPASVAEVLAGSL